MDEIRELFNIDFSTFIITVFVILVAIIAMVAIIGEFSKIIGKPVKWIKNRDEDHEQLMQTMDELKKLEERHETDSKRFQERNDQLHEDITNLTNMFVDKELSDMRWELLSFSARITDKKSCSKESFKHCIKVYEKYEGLLKELGLENGEVDISMKVVNDAYEEKLKTGF